MEHPRGPILQAQEKINILLVDDSATNLLALESILRAPDRNLIRADCGEDALRYLLDNEAAVVLLDVYMPGIDGLETAELIRGREKSRDIPIIFLTANTTGVSHLSRGYSLGAVDYIVKPVEPEILRSKVAVFVDLFKKTQEIKRQAQLLYEKNLELENANLARLNMLIDLGYELAAEHEPVRLLAKFCPSSRRTVRAEEAAVCVLDSGAASMAHFYYCSERKETDSIAVIPPSIKRALDRVIIERRALRLSQIDEPGLTAELDFDSMQSFLGAPIMSGEAVSGWLYLLNKSDADDFSEADEKLAVTLATQVSVAYENARLYTEEQSHAAELRSEMAVRKQAEEERAQLLVREQAARAEAEMANRTKDEFLATLSHELRTPLSAILGWSHILSSNKLGKTEFARGLETIERNARVQSQLIDDLLDVSRIISGKIKIEANPVDLLTIIEACLDSVRPAVEAKEIQFTIDAESGSCRVFGDPNRLQQIFWNLFSNAVKFTPQCGQVTVKVRAQDYGVKVSVIDSGVGINPEFLPYIFDRFRQGDGSTTRAHGGLGLGLAIVRHLVDLHQGKVEAESQGADQGSTFTVTLPVSNDTLQAANSESPAAESQALGVSSANIFNGVRILVVDDEPDSRDLICTILTRCGSVVRCSESASDAIQAFTEWNPDLLLSDIAMPNEEGYSLIRKVRKLRSKRAKTIPAIALTAYATEEDRSMALAAGFQTHLAKPVEPDSLLESIASALGGEIPTSGPQ